MRIVNTSSYPTAAVRTIIRAVKCEFFSKARAHLVTVTNCRRTGRGRYCGGRILIRIGQPTRFPTQYAPSLRVRRRTGGYVGWPALADPYEALAWIAGHEFAHCEERATEGWCDLRANKVLQWFQVHRADVDARIHEACQSEAEADALRRVKRTQARLPETILLRLHASLDRWVHKQKSAQNRIKKLRLRIHYYERRAAARKPPPK